MAEESDDPREVAWHPRFGTAIIGHQKAEERFLRALHSGKLHHAWLITGAKGIGKATLAYRMASYVLGGEGRADDDDLSTSAGSPASRWIHNRAHPDLFVLERQLNDSKPRRLKAEISVDDARSLTDFFSRTAGGGGWRVAIVDAADDLNTESANALLKLVEEPPPRCLLLLACHAPGRLIRTMRSRCTKLPLLGLNTDDVVSVVQNLPLAQRPDPQALQLAAGLSAGSPGRALELLNSQGAKAFEAYQALGKLSPVALIEFSIRFAGRNATLDDFNVFAELLLHWLGEAAIANATTPKGSAIAAAFEQISHSIRRTNALNLDRRQAVIDAVSLIDDAMRAA